jgi:hypothetical protein
MSKAFDTGGVQDLMSVLHETARQVADIRSAPRSAVGARRSHRARRGELAARRVWRWHFRSAVLVLLAVGLSACSQEIDYTPEQRSCIAQHYSAYDAKQINQCVDVCRVCMKGNVVTCNTSCRLRGAS